jgi:serine/threonine-protein kinase SRK2
VQVFLTSSHLVLAMEYAAGGDLFRYVSARRGLPEDEARWFFQQLMIAVDYCHRMVLGLLPAVLLLSHGWVVLVC